MKTSALRNGIKEKQIMIYQTLDQLSELKLHAMRYEFKRQQELPAMSELAFDDRFSMIVEKQWAARNETKINRLIKTACLREPSACLEHLDYDPVRHLKKSMVAQLSDCKWIETGSNMIITGSTGTGKTFLISAFGREACYRGYHVKSYRVNRLLTDLGIGRGDGSYNKLMQDLLKPDLLILDDFGMKKLDLTFSQDMQEVAEERYHSGKSMAITAQLPVKDWVSVFADLTVADATLDRIVRNAYRFELKGPSKRPTLEPERGDDDKTIES
jgi:DNA replication protein DnaC